MGSAAVRIARLGVHIRRARIGMLLASHASRLVPGRACPVLLLLPPAPVRFPESGVAGDAVAEVALRAVGGPSYWADE